MRLSGLLPPRLRWRLTLWVAAVMLVSVGLTFVVVYRDSGQQLRDQIDRDLKSDTSQLVQSLRGLAGEPPARVLRAARRYVSGQPYRSTSTLLFVNVPGTGTVSNHPELFGAATVDPGETVLEQTSENDLARALLRPRIGFATQRAPDLGEVQLLQRRADVGRFQVIVGAGDPLDIVARSQRGVAKAFLLAVALTLPLALLASYFAGARLSAPIRRLASVAARVDAGDLEPRIVLDEGQSEELRVLTVAFNHMLDRLANAFAIQREFIADASHELRTPLTVIRGQLEVLAAQSNPSPAEVRRVERLVQAEIGRISRLVDDLLVLARSEQTDFLRPQTIDLGAFVTELWDGISQTANRRFELGQIPQGSLLVDADRLAQALHNLLGNAIDHTRSGGLVRLTVDSVVRDQLRFTVTDDGPGIPAAERERIFERFHRTDESRTRSAGGAGLGLSIVRAIAAAHGGQVLAKAASDGPGACFELCLPGFRPGPGETPLGSAQSPSSSGEDAPATWRASGAARTTN